MFKEILKIIREYLYDPYIYDLRQAAKEEDFDKIKDDW